MTARARPEPPTPDHWQARGAGARYAGERWGSRRARERDAHLLHRLLRGRALPQDARVLDVPCGAGRLRESLATIGRTVGVDSSAEMLQAGSGPRMRASAFALPFDQAAFDLVVCCRLLHHLEDDAARRALLGELARVTGGWVAASYWDAASWQALRRRRGWRRDGDHRVAMGAAHLDRLLEEVGLRVRRRAHSMRFVSPQTWVLAEIAR